MASPVHGAAVRQKSHVSPCSDFRNRLIIRDSLDRVHRRNLSPSPNGFAWGRKSTPWERNMRVNGLTSCIALVTAALSSAVTVGEAQAQPAGGAEAEIAELKRQLHLIEQKLDHLEKRTTGNTAAAANAKAGARTTPASVTQAYPVKEAVAPSGAVVAMPNNRPTICTADGQNCVAITGRTPARCGWLQLPAQYRGHRTAAPR